MNRIKRTSLRSLLALAFVATCAFGVARADVRDYRVISARAGGVNLVAGDVKVRRAASADWLALSAQDELKSGDAVRTGSNGRVEILLNPGSYFRAGGSTEFTLADADLNKLRVELTRGSAVVEATGYSDMNLSIEVATPGALVRVERSGVYRFNAPAGGPTEVVVAKGRAVVGETVVKGGKVARASGGDVVEVAKFDKKLRDDLDLWSRERGKELAKANERLNRRALSAALTMGNYDSIFGRTNSPFGFWFYNNAVGCYTFLPFGYGWRSPYGSFYHTGIYRPRPDPSGGWIPPTVQPTGGGVGYNPGGGSPGGSGGPVKDGSPRDFRPTLPPSMPSPTRSEPAERPMPQRSIEPGHKPNN